MSRGIRLSLPFSVANGGLAWTYTQIGINKKPLTVFRGIEGAFCNEPPTTISLWPIARNAFGPRDVRIIMRPLGGKEYVVSDHLGSTRAVISDMGAILERKDYKPFGEVLATAGTGARTGYINREEDGESWLGSYGVRLYEPEYGGFTSVDVLWAEYAAHQPYQYSLNQPISLFDNGGRWVQAMDAKAREAIRQSVPSRFRSSISFSEQGILNIAPVKAAARGEDVNSNIAILSRLAENNETVQVSVTDEFQWKDGVTGEVQTRKFSEDTFIHGGDVPMFGVTLLPEIDREAANVPRDTPFSTNGTTQVVINPSPIVKGLSVGQTTAHELLGHFRMLLLAKQGKAVGAGHQKSDESPNKQVDDACKAAEEGTTR